MIGKVTFIIGALLWIAISIDYLLGKPTDVSEWLEFASGREGFVTLMVGGIGYHYFFERE
ncbi:hypothetical protein IID27_00340 [Patescibacteria group bacterium]|nr:hypothetical protein [Patescibacteria group bacterium]